MSSFDSSTSQPSLPLHRLRFVDWSPSTITALAISPSIDGSSSNLSSSSSRRGILAIGRQNGDIELCTWLESKAASKQEIGNQGNAKGWVVHTTLPGQVKAKVESLAFVNSHSTDPSKASPLRLFSSSGGAILTEHFLPQQLKNLGSKKPSATFNRPTGLSALFPSSSSSSSATIDESQAPGTIRTLPSLGGAIWSLAPSPTGKYLAIGCEDGYVRILDISDNKFEHLANASSRDREIVSKMSKAQGRVMSLAWGPPVKKAKAEVSGAARRKGDGQVHGSDSDSDSDDSGSDEDEEEEDAWSESFLFGGLGTSAALVWEAKSGRVTNKVLVQKAKGEQTIVWSVAVLPDGTLVTGDSTGVVTFFDARTRVPIPGATFKAHANGSDVLVLCVGPDGKAVYSAGVDQKVAEYALVRGGGGISGGGGDSRKKGGKGNDKKERWVFITARRLHAHDIRALAMDPPFDMREAVSSRLENRALAPDRLPILLSGGIDFNLVLIPASPPSGVNVKIQAPKGQAAQLNPISSNALTTFADTTQRRVPFVPSSSRNGSSGGGAVVKICASKEWILLRRETSVGIWKLDLANSDLEDELQLVENGSIPANWGKLIEMEIKTKTNITCLDISPDGQFLAVSDLYETKLFALEEREHRNGKTGEKWTSVEPRKLSSFGRAFGGQGLAPGASALCFTPDSCRLVIASWAGSYVHVLELPVISSGQRKSGTFRLLRSFGQHRRKAGTLATDATGRGDATSSRAIAGRNASAGSNGHANGVQIGGGGGKVNGDAAGASSGSDEEMDLDDSSKDRVRVERTTQSLIHLVNVSPDGAWLSTVSSDLQHHIFNLDSLTHSRTLPSPSSLPSGASFHPDKSGLLTLIFSDNKAVFWDVEEGKELVHGSNPKEVAWSRGLTWALNEKLSTIREAAVGNFWLPTRTNKDGSRTEAFVAWGPTWIATARTEGKMMVNAQQQAQRTNQASNLDEAQAATVAQTSPQKSSKRALGDTSASSPNQVAWNVRVTFKYQPLVFVGSLKAPGTAREDHLVVLERPFFELARNLPPAFYRGARYGA
ncbi:WD40 repeat-like protein [Violaceomyces palustris]|uniref:WD40 repeat-like protein n=1 Tax=Violaceomyces palustris TaxID=1673888 RepID=A0ACD0P231_9BASI|nr:WD40 repeat-like protein [Violaceomyces palustris]